jgi:hypothetical protein
MVLFWKIRYLDTRDREFKDRNLWLDTDTLDPLTKAAVEATNELKQPSAAHGMLKYRQLFKPESHPGEIHQRVQKSGRMGSVFIHEYHEDENGKALTAKQFAKALTGSETAVLIPPGFNDHDIEYMFAEKAPIDIDQLSLSPSQLSVLGYFVRDLKEMKSAAFFKEGPGTLSSGPGTGSARTTLQTAVTDEEIRSFVTTFRRLYMQNEPANLQKAVEVFTAVLAGHPVAKWIGAGAAEIVASLGRPPDFAPFAGPTKQKFTVKQKSGNKKAEQKSGTVLLPGTKSGTVLLP